MLACPKTPEPSPAPDRTEDPRTHRWVPCAARRTESDLPPLVSASVGWYRWRVNLLNLFTLVYTAFLTVGGFLVIFAGVTEARAAKRKWLNILGLVLVGVWMTFAFGQAFVRVWNLI